MGWGPLFPPACMGAGAAVPAGRVLVPDSALKWLKQTFDEADKNGDGSLSISEVLQLLHKLNVNLPRQRVKQMFQVGQAGSPGAGTLGTGPVGLQLHPERRGGDLMGKVLGGASGPAVNAEQGGSLPGALHLPRCPKWLPLSLQLCGALPGLAA